VGTLYLLDTNILVHFVRDSRVWRRIVGRYDLLLHDPTPLISVVSIGELRAIARRNGWGLRRLSQADYICSHLLPVTISDDPIFNAYALIATHTTRAGRPMGENDIWIAATARAAGATILTTDHDFDHLAPALVRLEWFDPALPTGGTP
jgi:tRNA(fMet)-specific endonuclease VapC